MKLPRLLPDHFNVREKMPLFCRSLIILFLLATMPLKTIAQDFSCATDMTQYEEETESCYLPLACGATIPFTKYWDQLEGEIVVKVNFHFVRTGNHGINFSATPDINGWTGSMIAEEYVQLINDNYAREMQDYLQFQDENGNTLPNPIPRLDRLGFPVQNLGATKIRLELYTDPNNTEDLYDGVWYHYDEDFNYRTGGKASSTQCTDCGNQTYVPLTTWKAEYSGYGDEVIDIFIYDEYWNCESCYSGRGRAEPGGAVFGLANIWHYYQINNGQPFGMAGTLWHELGHMFGLGHTFSSACCQADERDLLHPTSSWNNTNNVMGYNGCQCFYAPCQLDQITNFAYKHTGNSAKWIELVGNFDEIAELEDIAATIEITSAVVWDSPKKITGNVWIKPGGSLSITSTEIGFAEKSIIQVDRGALLLVDDSKLYNLCANSHWAGIRVAGNTSRNHPNSYLDAFNTDNQDPGRVVIINNSLIVRARWTIITEYAFEYREDHWGGYIYCKDSEFRNCARAAAFMKYELPNKSIFYNVKVHHTIPASIAYQYTGSSGVSLWATNGVTFTKCHFHQLDAYGIFTIDGSFFVDSENRFTDIKGEGIHLSQSHSLSHLADVRIGDPGNSSTAYNEFNGNFNHIRISGYGSLKYGAIITRNEFQGNYTSTTPNNKNTSIIADGMPSINIDQNKFDNNFISISIDNSEHNQNAIWDNYFEYSNTGIWYKGYSRRAAFACNYFKNYMKAAVYVNGTINPSQGNFAKSPANYWDRTELAGTDIFIEQRDVEIFGGPGPSSTPHFSYYYKPDQEGFNSGFRPRCNLTDQSSIMCTTFHNYVTPTSSGSRDCDVYENLVEEDDEMQLDLTSIRSKIDSLETNVIDYENNSLYRVLSYVKNVQIKDSLSVLLPINQFSTADALLAAESETEYKRMRYSLKLLQADYSGASTYLNSLPAVEEEDNDFYETQVINIKRLSIQEYYPDDSEWVTLEEIALKSSLSGAYAKSILTYFEARSWDTEYPDYPEDSIVSKPELNNSIAQESVPSELKVYPNPSNGFVRIDGIGSEFKRVNINVFSLLGKIVFSANFESEVQDLNLSRLSPGLYILAVHGDGKSIGTVPLFIQK